MRAATTVGVTAIFLLVAEVWVGAAGADDAIKPGKWEFWMVGSKLPGLTQLPPGARWDPEGPIQSWCISETNLAPSHREIPAPGGSCDFDTTPDANAGTVSWSVTSAWSSGNRSDTEAVMHFYGDTLAGMTTTRHSFPDSPSREYSSP